MRQLIIVLCFFIGQTLIAQSAEKTLSTVYCEQKIKVDGLLNEELYQRLVPAEDFLQFHPRNGDPATLKTLVYSFYDHSSIYFAFQCLDGAPREIAADITPFGQYENNDEVCVYIDTFLDKLTYERFAVNARGVKSGKETVWDAAARIHDQGWSVEFKIPFKSLRFPINKTQQWAVNFERFIQRLNERDYWTRVERNMQKTYGDTFGRLQGLQNVRGGKNVEIFPYGALRNSHGDGENETKLAYGLDIKYGITSNLTLDATTSPDYSQVETDPFFYQWQPYEVKLTENRPFYNEGINFFETPAFNLFYSRRISNPTLAFKITGKEKGLAVGLLGANNRVEGQNHFHGTVRLRQDVFKLSTIGVIYSCLEGNGEWNRNVGLDFSFKFKNIYSLRSMAVFTFNKNAPSGKNGMYYLWLSRSVDKGLTLITRLVMIEPNVTVPAGYVEQTDIKTLLLLGKYGWRWEKRWLESLAFIVWKTNQRSISDDLLTQDWYTFILRGSTRPRLDWTLSCGIGRERPRIYDAAGQLVWDSKVYNFSGYTVSLAYNGSRWLEFSTMFNRGRMYVYNGDFTATRMGLAWDASLQATIKISPQVKILADLSHQQWQSDDGTINFHGNLLSASLYYQVSNRISTFAKLQYDSYLKRYGYDLLIDYEPANVSKIYLSIKNYSEEHFRFLRPQARSITMKVSYLLRF